MGFDLAYGLERSEVVFATGLEADVAEIGGVGDQRPENIPKHGAVGLAVLNLGAAYGPGDVKDMGNVGQRGELGEGILRIGDVALDVLDGMIGVPTRTRAASHAVNLPWTAGSVRER